MKKVHINTIMGKSILLISGISLAVIILISFFMPSILYQIMKPQIINNVSNLVSTNAIRQSVIWRLNQVAFTSHADEELQQWLIEYYFSPEKEKSELKDLIESKAVTQSVGQGGYQRLGEGVISATTYSMVYTENGDAFYGEDANEIASLVLQSDWIRELRSDMSYTYSPVIFTNDTEIPSIICFVIPIDMTELNGYFIHMLDFAFIKEQFQGLEQIGIQDYVLTQSDRTLFTNAENTAVRLTDYPPEVFEGEQYQCNSYETDTGIFFYTRCSYEEENYGLAVYADRDTLLTPYDNIFLLIQLVLYCIIIIILIIVFFTNKGMLSRLTQLNRKMHAAKNGYYDVTLEDRGNDEIGELTETFNVMMRTIKQDIENRVESEKKEQQMQYSLLVSAIDPHFIYNTLNTITFLSKLGKNKEIEEVNKALIVTLKDRLTTKNCKTFDTIRAEKEVLNQYMVIQSYLCHNNINYKFYVSEEDANLQIPKNILQPIVENCIKHGLLLHKNQETLEILDGKIEIDVKRKDDFIELTISDGGIGMSEEQIEKYFNKNLKSITEGDYKHIGIYNIRMRLSYLYKDQYQMSATSENGTTIKILLPITS